MAVAFFPYVQSDVHWHFMQCPSNLEHSCSDGHNSGFTSATEQIDDDGELSLPD